MFKIYTEAKNWTEAEKACEMDGGRLAVRHSEAEDEVLNDREQYLNEIFQVILGKLTSNLLVLFFRFFEKWLSGQRTT